MISPQPQQTSNNLSSLCWPYYGLRSLCCTCPHLMCPILSVWRLYACTSQPSPAYWSQWGCKPETKVNIIWVKVNQLNTVSSLLHFIAHTCIQKWCSIGGQHPDCDLYTRVFIFYRSWGREERHVFMYANKMGKKIWRQSCIVRKYIRGILLGVWFIMFY